LSRAIITGLVLACVVGCSASDLFAPGAHDEPALIIFYGDTSRILAPETVVHGTSFDVSFITYGGGCTRTVAHTDVAVTGNVAVIRPYNRTTGRSTCTSDLRFLTHETQLRADTPGAFTIRVLGEQRGASTGSANGPAELTRTVVIR
jgi:hypothetical protein